jgi:hypothetical protein
MHLEPLILDTYEEICMGIFTVVLGQAIAIKIDL